MRALAVLMLVAGCPASAPPAPLPVQQPTVAIRPADLRAMELLRAADAGGAVLVVDVESGAVVASAGLDRDVDAPVLPLSVIKLYVAALWWDHELGDRSFEDPRHGPVSVHDTLVEGYDRPGALIAIELRQRIGGETVLAELRRLGLGPTLTLAADADNETWGSTLSIGETDMRVTLATVSRFLRGVATARLVKGDAAPRLFAAMRGAVEHGTAKSAAPRVPAGWHLGGKTGTGPAAGGEPYDGWFAGLIFDGERPRYTVAVYIDRGGTGGGIAAGIAADLASFLAKR